MIKVQNYTPEFYNSKSRDFQFLGRVFDIALNSIKTNSDLIYNIPLSDNSDTRFLDLVTTTLGFKSIHHYNTKQLAAMCSAFSYMLKNKGTLKGIETAVNILLKAENIDQEAYVNLEEESYVIEIYIPIELKDTTLLKDLLNYILPAGMSCRLIRSLSLKNTLETKLEGLDSLTFCEPHKVAETSIVPKAADITQALTDDKFITSRALEGLIDNSTLVSAKDYEELENNHNE